MNILLDENIPRKLTDALRKLGHTVESVHTLRLDGTANGELDAKITPDYELCFTKDEGFAKRKRSGRGKCKILRVTLRQQPQEQYVSDFIDHFSRTDWNLFSSGDDWP